MNDQIIIEDYNPLWANKFLNMAQKIRNSLGDIALRIDHIGSTSVKDLNAKPVIDIQISVKDFYLIPLEEKMNELGFDYQKDNDDKTHLFFREADGSRNYHIHIRRANTFSEVFNLLFRDYLRTHEEEANLYQQTKIELAEMYKDQREKYTDGKSDVIWDILQRANDWNQEIGWYPEKSDA